MNLSVTPLEISIALLLALVVIFVIVVQFNMKISSSRKVNKGNKQEVNGSSNININGVNGDVTINNPNIADDNIDSEINYDINILFIDDEQTNENDFQMIRLLKSNGFHNTHLVNDATVIQQDVTAAKIIFVDITGVGKIAGCNEGTELAVQIKKRYSNKKVVAIYSSTETHNIQIKGLNQLDYIFGKNDDFQVYLDFITEHARRN